MARAIWKGRIDLGGRLGVPVKLYAGVQDRKLHFRLLHRTDLTPIEQRIVDKADGREVAAAERRKALPLEADAAVIVQPDELDALQPERSTDIHLCRFVPADRLDEQWYDRPYWLGPDGDEDDYFACAAALERSARVGIARWVMRGKRYLGALSAARGCLSVVTLRRADQVLAVTGLDAAKSSAPDPRELELARQLLQAISGDWDPGAWHDEYRQRVCELIEAKARGRTLKAAAPPPRRRTADLADSLRLSLAAAKTRRHA